MSSTTLIFLLFVIGLPLAMMVMHRGGAGGSMGHGMGHGGHGHSVHEHAEPTATTRTAGGSVDLVKAKPDQGDDRRQRGGHGCC